MTSFPAKHLLWNRLGRSLLPTHGARANAADSLLDLQRTRRTRAEAAEALNQPGPPRRGGGQAADGTLR